MQTYKIYINERPLILAEGNNILDFPPVPETHLLSLYQGNKRFLLNYVDALEKGGRFDSITLFYPDFDKMKADFQLYLNENTPKGPTAWPTATRLEP